VTCAHLGNCGLDVSRSPAPELATLVTDYDDEDPL
jgi:hypothetical protein